MMWKPQVSNHLGSITIFMDIRRDWRHTRNTEIKLRYRKTQLLHPGWRKKQQTYYPIGRCITVKFSEQIFFFSLPRKHESPKACINMHWESPSNSNLSNAFDWVHDSLAVMGRGAQQGNSAGCDGLGEEIDSSIRVMCIFYAREWVIPARIHPDPVWSLLPLEHGQFWSQNNGQLSHEQDEWWWEPPGSDRSSNWVKDEFSDVSEKSRVHHFRVLDLGEEFPCSVSISLQGHQNALSPSRGQRPHHSVISVQHGCRHWYDLCLKSPEKISHNLREWKKLNTFKAVETHRRLGNMTGFKAFSCIKAWWKSLTNFSWFSSLPLFSGRNIQDQTGFNSIFF